MSGNGFSDNRGWVKRLIVAQARREQIVNFITLGITVAGAFTSLWMLFLWLRYPGSARLSTAVVGIVILVTGMVCYMLSRTGRVTIAAWLTLLPAIAIATHSIAMRGITSVNAIIFAPTVALAGMLIGRRAAVIVAGIDALIVVGLGLAQGAGWQPPQAQASISLGVLVVIGSLAFLLLLNGLSWRLMEESLVLAEAQTERLRVVHEDQQRLVVDLKVQSQRQAQLLATLRELSTPVIPVSKEVVVLPLVGHVDMERLDIVRTALMDGIARYRASVALLEMTGLRELDSEIVQGLLGLTDVARLLGAELVMVGVQPEMARLIVELDVDTSRLTARSDLESALAYALAQRQRGRPLSHSSHPVKLAETGV